jgi:hypothetical protein
MQRAQAACQRAGATLACERSGSERRATQRAQAACRRAGATLACERAALLAT